MPSIQYDPQIHILKIRMSRKKSVDSDVQGNVVLDYDKNGEIVNIEIMDINLNEFVSAKNRQRLFFAPQ